MTNKTTQEIVEQRVGDGSLRQALENRRPANRNINAVIDRALRGKPLHGLKLVETGELREVLSHGHWSEEQIDFLIQRGEESSFMKQFKRTLAAQGIDL